MRKKPFANDLYVISSSVAELKRAVVDGAAIVQLRDKTETRPQSLKRRASLSITGGFVLSFLS
jgi:thiamine monophosphate synthase